TDREERLAGRMHRQAPQLQRRRDGQWSVDQRHDADASRSRAGAADLDSLRLQRWQTRSPGLICRVSPQVAQPKRLNSHLSMEPPPYEKAQVEERGGDEQMPASAEEQGSPLVPKSTHNTLLQRNPSGAINNAGWVSGQMWG